MAARKFADTSGSGQCEPNKLPKAAAIKLFLNGGGMTQ